jgi:hypothetical protein
MFFGRSLSGGGPLLIFCLLAFLLCGYVPWLSEWPESDSDMPIMLRSCFMKLHRLLVSVLASCVLFGASDAQSRQNGSISRLLIKRGYL